jgi:uncharacterized RDD family membrane protein YckC
MSEIHGTLRQDPASGELAQLVHSPEQVALELPLAGPTSRILAYAVDALGIYSLEAGAILLLLLATPAATWLSEQLRGVGEAAGAKTPQEIIESGGLLYLFALFVLLQLAIEWGYFLVFELTTGGRSPGKALLGLRVLRDGGEPIDLRASLVRNLLRVVDVLPANYLIGLTAMVLSPESKRLGDFAAGTIVVRLDRPPVAAPLTSETGAEPRFRFDRAQIARLGRAERTLLRQTLRRVQDLDGETGALALERAADVLARRIGQAPVAPAEREAFLRALLRAAR